jgi:hypothetical protein
MQMRDTARTIALGLAAATLYATPAAAHGDDHGHGQPWWWHPPARTGVLAGGPGATAGGTPGAIAGVGYATLGAAGVTDATGAFRTYGHPVAFSIGHLMLGTSKDDTLVTPFALAGPDDDCTTTDAVVRDLQLLEALDADQDPANGIAISATTRARAARWDVPLVSVAALDDARLRAIVTKLTGATTLPDRAAVRERFLDQVDAETWTEQGHTTYTSNPAEMVQILTSYNNGVFPPTDLIERQGSLVRSQGLASDGRSLTFSWQFGLMRTTTDPAETPLARNTLAIPPAIAAQGGNHIGDIDIAGGKVYAPIEDGAKRPDGTRYQHPFIALYDAKTLNYTGEAHELPQALHTEGVPWIAVDAARGVFYTAEWNDTKIINVFDLRTFALRKTITLSQTLGRIQGAKVHDGMLYAFADLKDVPRPVYKIDPDTGHVLTVATIALPAGSESEGLAFYDQPDGTALHTLDVTPDSLGVDLRDHALTQPSLRSRVCG